MRLVLFKGLGQYGSLRLHIDQLAAALESLGHEVRTADLSAADGPDQLRAVQADPPDCYFGISGIGSDLKIGDASAYDVLGTPYASLYVDHPLHHLPRLQEPIRKQILFFLDRSHLQFVNAWAPPGAFSHLGFLPPGANELPDPPNLSDEAFAARDIPVLFTGTYRGPPQATWRQWPDTPAKTLAEAVAARMTADARLPILDVLRAVLKGLGTDLTPQLTVDIAPILQVVQMFSEAYHRDALIHRLGQAGAPLNLYGSGWEPMAERYPSFTYGGVGSFAETLHLLRRARVVLNTSNGFVAGGHERVFTAMCGGAAVFSDQTRYLLEAFRDGREIATFAWPKMEEAPERLSRLLADPVQTAAIARAGAKKAMAEHRWTHRATRIVNAVKQAG